MTSKSTLHIIIINLLILCLGLQANAQNKNVDKGKETLTKAMEQTGAKRQELIGKAREEFQKGGLKPQEVATLMGDAYLEKNDLADAATAYGSASKDDKKEGLKKVADAYVEQAFGEDDKAQPKTLSKAMSLYNKADATKEGARNIGDKFYEKGEAAYPQALNYYVTGGASAQVEQIAKSYFAKGGDNEDKAAETYLKLKTPEGAKSAGDIYYNRQEYQKAIEAYLSGGVSEGIHKYADYLYGDNRNEEADALIMKLADAYVEKKNDGLEKLASEVMAKGDYAMAAKIYDKAGNGSSADKCKAYDALVSFRFDDAKAAFSSIGDDATAKMITDNEKALTPLKDLADNFDELMKAAPYVTWLMDTVTGKSSPSADDERTREDYYKSIRDQIIKNVNAVSTDYFKLTSPDIKKFVRQRFLKYGAVRNILDKETFMVKKQKADIRTKDVIL